MTICQRKLKEEGQPYPRTCPTCGIFGKCVMGRTMTIEEQEKLLETLASTLWSASMENMDDVLYGSIASCEKSGNEFRLIQRIMAAVPKDIVDDYNSRLRKKKADELRAKADSIERGSPTGDEMTLRCEITGNPVGTDTRPLGKPCPCPACQLGEVTTKLP